MSPLHHPSLLRAVAETPVFDHVDYRAYLLALYTWLKGNLDRYSYLSFAEDLGFSRTNVLHLIVVGKRPLTVKAAHRIADSLQIKGLDRRYLETLVRYNNSRRASEREDLFQQMLEMKARTLKNGLDKSQLEFFCEWYHPVILEMTLMPTFQSDIEWIAREISPKIRPEQARKSLDLLTRLNLIKFDENKRRHVAASSRVTSGDEIASLAVVSYHQHMIELAKEAITSVEESERDISAITVCVSAETAAKIKREIQAFRKHLLSMAEAANDVDRVYQLNFQFFPVTRPK